MHLEISYSLIKGAVQIMLNPVVSIFKFDRAT